MPILCEKSTITVRNLTRMTKLCLKLLPLATFSSKQNWESLLKASGGKQ